MFLQVGIQHKPDDLYIKTSNLVEVDVLENQVCNNILKITWSMRKIESILQACNIYLFFFLQVKMCHLPRLPRQRDLVSQLTPIHARLSSESAIAKKHPIHRCNEIQVFLVSILEFSSLSHLEK